MSLSEQNKVKLREALEKVAEQDGTFTFNLMKEPNRSDIKNLLIEIAGKSSGKVIAASLLTLVTSSFDPSSDIIEKIIERIASQLEIPDK